MGFLRRLIQEKWLEFILAGVVLQLFASFMIALLRNDPLFLLVAFVAILLLLTTLLVAADVLKIRRRVLGRPYALGIQRRGVIFTVGLRSHHAGSPALKVLETLKPEYCAFLGTDHTARERVEESLAAQCQLRPEQCHPLIAEPTNVSEIKTQTELLISWLLSQGLRPKDIVLDITGGTAVMSVASFLAAEAHQIDTQYIYSEYEQNRPVEGTQEEILISSYGPSPPQGEPPPTQGQESSP